MMRKCGNKVGIPAFAAFEERRKNMDDASTTSASASSSSSLTSTSSSSFDPFTLEKWPLIQAFALEGLDDDDENNLDDFSNKSSGFFTMVRRFIFAVSLRHFFSFFAFGV